ncbi:hemerythrin domain-containing protein [Microbispora corallina]|uniref:Hemerythrin n=1 Tax=Microbispora corallina TaxID=83302 RepID=A0ABQ4FTL9_9ACTN|nr:hemerythrin domain-containing protein [Microbispora corallina]GIH38153.1 hemerythrin [Microbispora corallina]
MATDVISLIKEDHRDVESIFERLQKVPENRPALVAELAAKFVAHARAEESEVYPLLEKRDPEEASEVHHGAEEHHEAEETLAQLMAADPDGPEFDSILQELVAAVSHHVQEEETDILPALEKAVPAAERVRLGKVFSQAKAQELQSPPKPRQRSKDELLHQAEELGIQGRSAMSKEELLKAIKSKQG